jgi:hypothetical protein
MGISGGGFLDNHNYCQFLKRKFSSMHLVLEFMDSDKLIISYLGSSRFSGLGPDISYIE